MLSWGQLGITFESKTEVITITLFQAIIHLDFIHWISLQQIHMIILLIFTEYFEDIKKKEDYSFKNEVFVTVSFFYTSSY